MNIIYNKIIPVKGFTAMNLYGNIFAREEYEPLRASVIQHEAIHKAQMLDFAQWLKKYPTLQVAIGGTIFYLIYLLEWIYRLIFHTKTAYRGISFEVEAYDNAWRKDYLKYRKPYAMWRKKKNK